ncbi:hypothetical protein CGZ80_15535 [Rhodopirellula sp. MGV]|nr:hypothetical protein CGZ80_15535 [Rhodopirellula sp. MGV]PNY37372.1 hypothetical protein C2E31_07490 [Rhodopirellula baltica]
MAIASICRGNHCDGFWTQCECGAVGDSGFVCRLKAHLDDIERGLNASMMPLCEVADAAAIKRFSQAIDSAEPNGEHAIRVGSNQRSFASETDYDFRK